MRRSSLIALGLLWAGAVVDAAPERVVSINLCTDQLALSLAAPGQLISVTHFARDPLSSPMHAAASALPGNAARAEEVYLMQPDLVLAGTFTSPATVQMLESLGIPVEVFAPANALTDVSARMTQMGKALGRAAEAKAAAQAFDAELAALSDTGQRRPRAALYYVNSYSSGNKTLAGDILKAAGFDNVAGEVGLEGIGKIGLEDLILLGPEVIIQGRGYQDGARASANLEHPALDALGDGHVFGDLIDRDWVCGTPFVLDAVERLRALRLDLEPGLETDE